MKLFLAAFVLYIILKCLGQLCSQYPSRLSFDVIIYIFFYLQSLLCLENSPSCPNSAEKSDV